MLSIEQTSPSGVAKELESVTAEDVGEYCDPKIQ